VFITKNVTLVDSLGSCLPILFPIEYLLLTGNCRRFLPQFYPFSYKTCEIEPNHFQLEFEKSSESNSNDKSLSYTRYYLVEELACVVDFATY